MNLASALWQTTRVAALGLLAMQAWGADEVTEDAVDTAAEPSGVLQPKGGTLQGGTAARVQRKTAHLTYPSRPRDRGQEGWVRLSFSVLADGTVADPIVEDSSGIAEFERAAITSILRTRYDPATWNGKPIEQCAANMNYVFSMGGTGRGARPKFIQAYKATVALTQEQRMAEAEAKLDEMTAKGTWRIYESARLWLMRASFQGVKGDQAGELRSLNRATLSNGAYLEAKLYREALREMFRLELVLKDYAAALDTYDKLKKLKPPMNDPPVDNAAAQVLAIVNGPETLGFPGVMEYRSGCKDGRANFQHTLLRPKFTFSGIEGNVDDFELRCDWKRIADKVSTEKAWEVPTSWGWCQLFVFGDDGAKATIVEYPISESTQKERRKPGTKK